MNHTSDDPLKRLNILLLSGVLHPLSVAAASRLSPDQFGMMVVRKMEMGDREPRIRALIEDYARALTDVNMLWRDLGESPYIRDDDGAVKGFRTSMPVVHDDRIESMTPDLIAMLTPAERDEVAAIEEAARKEREGG